MGLKELLEERKQRKEREKKIYEEAYEKALKRKKEQQIRKRAFKMAGYKPAKKGKKVKEKKKARIVPRKGIGFLDVKRSVPQLGREESFASLMAGGRGISLTDFPHSGRSLMDMGKEEKKKRRFSLADW